MASAIKRCVQIDICQLNGHRFVNHTAAKAKNVGIVMAARHLRAVLIGTDGGADALHLIRGNAHTNAGAAAKDSLFTLSAGYTVRHSGRDRPVVDGLLRHRAEIPVRNIFLLQILPDGVFQCQSSMVAS